MKYSTKELTDANRTIRRRMEASKRGEEKGGATDDEMIQALITLMDEAHEFISEKVKNIDNWPFGMRAFRQNLVADKLQGMMEDRTAC